MSDTTQAAATAPTNGGSRLPYQRRLSDTIKLRTKLLTLSDLDRRTATFKNIQATIAGMEADLGGDLTTAQKQIVQRACLLGAMAADQEAKWLKGEPVDPAIVALLGNAQRRSLEALGLQRVAKDAMSLDQYLASTEHGNGQATGQEVVTVPARSARVNEKPTLEDWSEDNTAAEDEDTSDVENAA